jgi:hypothetical protein
VNIYEVCTAYADAQDAVTRSVKQCLTRPAELAKAVGIGKSQFYERMRESNWRPEEMLKLASILETAKKLTIGG